MGCGNTSKVWPRAAAVAERLWRGSATATPEASLHRFRALTALLQSRGIGAAPVDDAADGSSGGQQCPPLAPHLQRPVPLPWELKEGASAAAEVLDVSAAMRAPRLFDAADRHDLDDGALETNDSSKGVLEADDDVGGPVPASRVFPVFPAAASAEAARGVSVVQLNADDGGGGSAARVASIEAWLRDMALGGGRGSNGTEATGGRAYPAMAVGLCELNGWGQLGKGYLDHRGLGLTPRLVSRAAAAGLAHAHVWAPGGHPYALGVAARSPVVVVHEWGPRDGFERGVLHVRLPLEPGFDGRGAVNARGDAVWPLSALRGNTRSGRDGNGSSESSAWPVRRRGVDLVVVHLTPHDATQRLDEARKVHTRDASRIF